MVRQMFDFGFWELALILVISLVVLGPERLPIFASQLGSIIKKVKDFANNVKKAANKIIPEGIVSPYLSMGGEDFSYFANKVPGCYYLFRLIARG